MVREKIKKIIEDSDTKSGKIFNLLMQVIIVFSIITFSLETLPNIPDIYHKYLLIVEVIVIILFSIEYILRIYVADRKLSFVFSFYGIVDLLAIIPFYLSLGVDLRSLRIVRIIRVFRIFKLARYVKSTERFRKSFILIREELVLFTIAALILVYISSVGIYYFERDLQPGQFGSVFQCFWWAVITLTTVGYGDAYPITVGGRIFTSFILFLGIGIVAVPAGLFASALSKVRSQERDAGSARLNSNL